MPLRKKRGGGSTNTLGADGEERQMGVYTNWVNDKLKEADLHVHNLPKELGDGVLLIKLLETLSGKKIPGK